MEDCPPCTHPRLGRGPLLIFQKPWVLSAWMLTPSSDSRTGCFVTFRISSNTSGNVPGGERLERPPVDPRTSYIGDMAPLVLTVAGRLSTPTWPAGWEELAPSMVPRSGKGEGGPTSLTPLTSAKSGHLSPGERATRCKAKVSEEERKRCELTCGGHPHRSEGGSD